MKFNRDPALGDKVKCTVTGFIGTITTHAKHIAGCDRFWIEPQISVENKRMEGCWIDIDLIEIIEPNAISLVRYTRAAPVGFDLPPSR